MAITATANPANPAASSNALPAVLLALSAVLADLAVVIDVPTTTASSEPVTKGPKPVVMDDCIDLMLDLLEGDPTRYHRGTELVAAGMEQGFTRNTIYTALHHVRCRGLAEFHAVGKCHLYRALIARQSRESPKPCDCPERSVDTGTKLVPRNWVRR